MIPIEIQKTKSADIVTMQRSFLVITIIFILVSLFSFLAKPWLNSLSINEQVLLIGNSIVYIMHVIAAFFHKKTVLNTNTQVFIRGVYLGMMIKLFTCIIIAMLYIYLSDNTFNKPALFICMFLYLVYNFVEVGLLMKKFKSNRKNIHET